MLCGPTAHRGVRIADAPELVVLLLKKVRVYGPDAESQALSMLPQLTVVVHPVPGDVYGYRGADAGEAVDLGGVGQLLKGVAGDARLREHVEARSGVAVAPGRGLHALESQALLYPIDGNPPGREGSGEGIVGSPCHALQSSILLLRVERWRPSLTRDADARTYLEVVLVYVLL